MEFNRGFVMNHNDISTWFYIDEESIELIFTDWLKDDIPVDIKLKFQLSYQLKYLHAPYKKLYGKYIRGLAPLTSNDIRDAFEVLDNKGYTFKIYDRKPEESPWHPRLFAIDCMYKNKYKIQSLLKLPWWVE